jgi:hypothetical protein
MNFMAAQIVLALGPLGAEKSVDARKRRLMLSECQSEFLPIRVLARL